MTPTETAKLCTLSDLVLRDEDRRTDVVELANLGRVAGKVLGEMAKECDAYQSQRDAIESAKDVVARFAATADALTLDDRRAAFVRGWYEASGQEKLSLAERAWSGLVAAGVVR